MRSYRIADLRSNIAIMPLLASNSTLCEMRLMKRNGWRNSQATNIASQEAKAIETPLTRLPPEIRAQIYSYLVAPRRLHVNRYILASGAKSPTTLLVSRTFYAEIRDYLFENHTFEILLSGVETPQPCKRRRDTRKDIVARLKVVKTIVMVARRLRIILSTGSGISKLSPESFTMGPGTARATS